jgi:hypothetical protein
MSDKIYINKCGLRKKTFDNGGSVLNCSFNMEELQVHAKPGYKEGETVIRLIIAERRQANDKGYTHYAYLDPFEPKKKSSNESNANQPTQEKTNLGDDIPF